MIHNFDPKTMKVYMNTHLIKE